MKKKLSFLLALIFVLTLAFGVLPSLGGDASAFYGSLEATGYTDDALDEPPELAQGQIWTGKGVTADAGVMSNGIFNITLAAKVGVTGGSLTTFASTTNLMSYTKEGLTITDEIGEEFDFILDTADNTLLPFTFDGSTVINAVSTDSGNTYYYSGGKDFFTVTFNTVTGTVTLWISEMYLFASQGSLIDLTFGVVLSDRANTAGTYDTNGNFKASFIASENNPHYLSVDEGKLQTYTNTPESLGAPSTETSSVWGVGQYSFTPAAGHQDGKMVKTFLGTVFVPDVPPHWSVDAPPSNLTFGNMYVNTVNSPFDVFHPGNWETIPSSAIITGPTPSSDSLRYIYTYQVSVVLPDATIPGTSITQTSYSFPFNIYAGQSLGVPSTDFGLGTDGWAIGFNNVTKTVTTTPIIPADDEFSVTGTDGDVTVTLLPPDPDITYALNAPLSFSSYEVIEPVSADVQNVTTITRVDANHLTVVTDTVTKSNGAGFDGTVTQALEDTGWIRLAAPADRQTIYYTQTEYGTLTVDKTASSADATAAVGGEPFSFTVTFNPATVTGITNNLGLVGTSGVYTFTLTADAPAVVFSNIPTGTKYTVTEDAFSEDQVKAGWVQGTVTGDTGTISTVGAIAAFENVLTVVAGASDDGSDNDDSSTDNEGQQVAGDVDTTLPQTGGISFSTLLGILGLALIAAGSTAFTIFRKRNLGKSK